MKFLWFGKKSFSDLSLKDLEDRKIKWEIRDQKIANFIKQSEGRINGYMQAATEPGVSQADKEAAGKQIEDHQKQRDRFKRHQLLTRKTLNEIRGAIGLKSDAGLIGEINEGGLADIDLEELEEEISGVVTEIKEYETRSDETTAMLEYSSAIDTKSKESDEFRSIMAEIEKESEKKRSESDL